jgi:hypothetical protein
MNKQDIEVGTPKSICASDNHSTSERNISSTLLLNLQLNVQTRLIKTLRTTIECQKEVVTTLTEELELLQEQLEIQEFQNRKLQKDVGFLRTLVNDRHPRPHRGTLLPHETSTSSSISSISTLDVTSDDRNDDLSVVKALMRRLSILHFDKPATHYAHRCNGSPNNTYHIGNNSPVNNKDMFDDGISAFPFDKGSQRSLHFGKKPPSASRKKKGPTELSQMLTEVVLGQAVNFANDFDHHENCFLFPCDSIKLSKNRITARKKARAVDNTLATNDNTVIPLTSLAAEVCSIMSSSIQK